MEVKCRMEITYSRVVARKVHQNGSIVTTGSGPEAIRPAQEVDQNIVPIVTTLPVHYDIIFPLFWVHTCCTITGSGQEVVSTAGASNHFWSWWASIVFHIRSFVLSIVLYCFGANGVYKCSRLYYSTCSV